MNFTPTTDMVIEGATGTVSDVIFSGGSSNKGVFTVGGTGTSFSVRDATIQDGEGTESWFTLTGSGGGVFCQGSSSSSKSLSMDNVMMKNNKVATSSTTGAGSAIAAEYCDLSLIDVDVQNNTGGYYGAIAAMSSVVDMDSVTIEANSSGLVAALTMLNVGGGAISSTWKDVDIFDNAATPTSGPTYTVAVSGGSTSDIITVTGEDVLIDQNTSATATARDHTTLWISNATVTLEESFGSAGVTANDGLGVSLQAGGVFESTLADYGSSSTTNNETADIETDISTYNPGSRSSFVCDEDTCGNDGDGDGDPSNDEFVCSVGTANTSFGNVSYGMGNQVKADRNSTMESFDVYLTGNRNCLVDFYLMERVSTSGSSGTFKTLWRKLNVTNNASTSWLNSGHIGVPVESGKTYFTFTKSTCSSGSVSNYYHYSSTAVNPGFGTFAGYAFSSSSSDFALNSSQTVTQFSTDFRWYTRYNLNDLDTSSNATCIP
jgi:hypothetical protein